ncbi:PEP-CTERM sorting domain-containing protein [bacterium]|nr:PEP-CTERM sorting domain-containing protein [bacterium]
MFVTGFSTLSSTSLVEAGVISNGGFESPLATGWTVIGTASSTLLTGATPTEGSQYAFLNTIVGDPSVPAIENALGLTSGTLTGAGAQGGAAIYQDVTLNAGETLSFDWRFLSQLSDNSTANDFAFWSLTPNGIPGGYTQLADTFDVGSDMVGTFTFSTSAFAKAEPSVSSGTYTLGFGVMNFGNNLDAYPSGLLIDNISISGSSPAAVPEPGTLAMLGISTLGFGMGYVRKRKKITGSTDPSKESMI